LIVGRFSGGRLSFGSSPNVFIDIERSLDHVLGMPESHEHNTAALLKKLPAFASSDDGQIADLVGSLEKREAKAGELIIEQGAEADELFLVVEGKVEVFMREEAIDLEKELHTLSSGDLFGEVALLTGGVRTASARAVTNVKLLALHQKDFWQLLQESRTAAVGLCRLLGRHLESAFRLQPPIPFVKLADFPDAKTHRHLLPEKVSDLTRAIAVDHTEDMVTVAMVDPFNPDTRRFLGQVVHPLRLEFAAISDYDNRGFIRRQGDHPVRDGEEGKDQAEVSYLTPSGVEGELVSGSEVDGIIHGALTTALKAGASDIHFEPRRRRFQIRARIDGNLVELRDDIDSGLAPKLISRLKIMADLDVTARRGALDGGFAIRFGTREADARLSTIPSINGEKAVIRILDDETTAHDLAGIVLCKPAALMISQLFQLPSGLVLVTGPTGSGKTTTLYSGLNQIWETSRVKNIVTIEDPIDRRIDCATQIQVGTDGTEFHTILRSILRQDPDILLIGEMRDKESATIAHEAALTGHLVLSSVHSHFAIDVIARLKTLGVPPYLIASALKGIVSQRLIPALCPACATAIPQGDNVEGLDILVNLGILNASDRVGGKLKRPVGCEHCHMTGLKGRVGLFEVLTIGGEIRHLIETDTAVSKIEESLSDEWFMPMRQYARYLLLAGHVDPSSVLSAFPTPVFANAPLANPAAVEGIGEG
jgi:type II secretory ATPase GspE/PulE/Tfp pilus assembly ATPase PilB-like protein